MLWDNIKNCCSLANESLEGAYGWFAEIIAILVVVLGFNFIIKRLLRGLHQHFKNQNQIWKESFVAALYKPLSYYVWYFAIVQTLDMLALQSFSISYLPNKHVFLGVGAILSISWFLMRWKSNVTKYMIVKSNKHEIALEATKIDVIDKILTVLILFMTSMLLLEATGSNLNTLIAFGGIGGLAIAFSSQEIIASFFGGLMVYLTHPFSIGDCIVLPERNIEGNVEVIGWYSTRIKTLDKKPIYVPNAIFSKMVVVNPSRMSHRQLKEIVGIRYEDVNKLRPLIDDIKTLLRESEDFDTNMSQYVNFNAFGSYSLDILVCAYTKVTDNQSFYELKERFLFSILEILQKHEAELAFPTTTIEVSERKKPSCIDN